MAELSREPQRGEDILTAFRRLIREVRRERLTSVVGGKLKQTETGKTLEIPGAGKQYLPWHVRSISYSSLAFHIEVTRGKWIRNGITCDTGVDVGKTYKTLTAKLGPGAAFDWPLTGTMYVAARLTTDSNTPDGVEVWILETSDLPAVSQEAGWRVIATASYTFDSEGYIDCTLTDLRQRSGGDIVDWTPRGEFAVSQDMTKAYDAPAITVAAGTWSRCGKEYAYAGVSSQTLTLGATSYVYAYLYGTGPEPGIAPTEVRLDVLTTPKNETDETHAYRLLAVVTVDSVGWITRIVQTHVGRIYEAYRQVDSAVSGTDGTSLEKISATCTQKGADQISGWRTAAETSQAVGDLLLANRAAGGVRTAVYLDPADLSVSHADTAGTVATVPLHDHGAHTGLGDDDHAQYVLRSGDATRNAMSGTLGDASNRVSVQPDARTLNDQDGAATVAWGTADRFLQLQWTVRGGNFRAGYNAAGSVDASFVYEHGGHVGASHAKKITLTDVDGGTVDCYLRGGILCVD